jgi:hypothetical protein
LYVHQSNSPKNAVPGAGSPTNGIGVNLEFGFFNFSQLNRAVYAAREQAGTGNTPNIHVKSNTTEDETAVITKSINIFGDSTACGSQSTIKLANSLNMPIVWAYGLNTQIGGSNNNGDALTRTPNGITLKFLNFAPNDVQSSGSATPSTGPAMLVTGASGGSNTPTGVQLYSCAMSPVFDGSPLAITTDQDGSLTGRYAAHPVTIDARFTKKSNNCDLLLVDIDVRDNSDNPILALIRLDDVVDITVDCAQLQNAINVASVASPRTTIRVLTNLNCPVISANTTAKIRIETITPSTLIIGTFNLNNGGGQGGNVAVCGMEVNSESSGITTISRVNVWPPACLNDAANIVTDNPSHVVVAANSNAVVGVLPFTESLVDSMNYVILQKRFDMFVANGATAINPSPTSANQTFTGRFIIQDRLFHDGSVLGHADVPVIAGTMYSTNGTTFGSDPVQVEMKHSRLNADLTNYDFHYAIPFYGGSIEMGQQFINPTLGSRRMNFTNPTFGEFAGEDAAIYKRVFVNGLADRGTQTGIIRLQGSGNCQTSGPDESSVLRNLSITQVDVATNTDCIQTAIGRVISCDVSNQDLEGAGTNSTNGSGGTVNLFNNTFTQNIEIAKEVTINEGSATNNGAVILRRGAIVLGTIGDFTNTVNMNQCYPAHSNGLNPDPYDGIDIATAVSGTVNFAGYGSANPVGQGSEARGVWQFNNVGVNKDVTINGQNSGTKTSNCAANGLSIASNETVIGGSDAITYSTTDPIFLINSNGVTISGLAFTNINATAAGAADRYAIRNNGAFNGVTISNNLLVGTSASMPGMIDAASISATKQNWIITGNYVSATNIGAPAMLVHFDNGTANSATTIIHDNKIDMNNQSGIDGIAVSNVDNSAATLANTVNYPATNYFNIDANHISNIHNDSRGIRLSGSTDGINGVLVRRNTIIGDATMAAKTGNGVAIDSRLTTGGSTGSKRINIRNNYINYCNNGVHTYHGTLTNDGGHFINLADLTIDSNHIANNTNGVHIDEIKGYMWSELDCRFNWWGSVVGPTIDGTLSDISTSFTQSYPTTFSTYQPFSPVGNVSNLRGSYFYSSSPPSYAFYPLYVRLIPEAISANDRVAGTCGWQPQYVMGPVLRVNNAQNEILSMDYSVKDARDGLNDYPVSGGIIIPDGIARSNDDKLWVLGKDRFKTDGSSHSEELNLRNPNGYPMSAFPENPTYPVVFGDAITAGELVSQPSAVIGRLDPLYPIPASGTGAIRVASNFPQGFEISSLDVTSAATGTSIVFQYSNGSSSFNTLGDGLNNIADNQVVNTANPAANFTGILIDGNNSANLNITSNSFVNEGSGTTTRSRGIIVNSLGLDGSSNKVVSVQLNGNSVSLNSTASSSGIYVNAVNANQGDIDNSNIIGVSVTNADIIAHSPWGNGIQVDDPQNLGMRWNSVTGGNNTAPTRFSNGIVINRPLANCQIGDRPSYVYDTWYSPPSSYWHHSNNITSTFLQETSSNPTFGYGIKVYSSTGIGSTNGIIIDNNRIGGMGSSPASAGILLAGFNGTANATVRRNVITGVNSANSSSGSNSAALQIFTSTLAGQPTSGTIAVDSNVIGNNQPNGGNTLGLAIGTNESGTSVSSNANNLTVNVTNNYFRSHAQTVGIGTNEVADGRPTAGQDIRNMFSTGNNSFSYGAILTGEGSPGNYLIATSRTAIAQPFGAGQPVRISRLIATPLNATTSDSTTNTVEIAANRYRVVYATGPLAGTDAIESSSNSITYNASIARHYYAEQLSAGNKRILMNGPSGTFPARILAGSDGTGIAFTSTERENKDIRGNLQLNAINAGLYGQVPPTAANKGDIYLQRSALGTDNGFVTFWYHSSTLGSQSEITGLFNSTAKASDIKAGLDDADDDNFAGSSSSTDSRRRTGVFVAGNGSSFEKNTSNEAITGTNVLNVYPNPASGDVTVAFRVPMEGIVRVALYNALGEKVTDLREEYLSVDNYTTSFSGANLPSGTYHVRLVHDLFTRTVPVTIIK